MFTKQHYGQLAEMLGVAKDLDDFINILVVYFKADNEKFDEHMFIRKITKVRKMAKKVEVYRI